MILLTGGAGYIGSHTALELLRQGYEVAVIDNLSNSSEESLKRVERLSGKCVKFYKGDVCIRTELDKVFDENEIDAVIHFAGYKAVGESVAKPVMYYRNNLDSTLTLLECMKDHDCKKIIFSSSATVYGVPESVPLNESSPAVECSNPYGRTKLFIEHILKDTAKANPEMCVSILRYFNPIGADESGMIGENPSGIPNNLMPYITQVAMGIRDHLNIFGNDYPTPDGTGIRDYIHVSDLAKGHVAALRHIKEGAEVYNLGTGNGVSVLELVNTFERVNNIKIPYVFAPRRAGDVTENFADASKAERELGWKAEKTVEDMCRDSYNWQKKNPHGYNN